MFVFWFNEPGAWRKMPPRLSTYVLSIHPFAEVEPLPDLLGGKLSNAS